MSTLSENPPCFSSCFRAGQARPGRARAGQGKHFQQFYKYFQVFYSSFEGIRNRDITPPGGPPLGETPSPLDVFGMFVHQGVFFISFTAFRRQPGNDPQRRGVGGR